MTSVYLKCDSCGKELSVERVVQGRNAHWYDSETLIKHARQIGWTGPLSRQSNLDKCPECSKCQVQVRNQS